MTHQGPNKLTRKQLGLSLVEALMAVAIAAIATGTSLPSFKKAVDNRRIDSVAAQLQTDLQLARSEAVARNRTLRISFNNNTQGSCYVVHTGAASACACDSSGMPMCQAEANPLRVAYFPADAGTQVQSNVASMVLDNAKGTVTPTGTVRVLGTDGRAVNVVVNIMGRIRKCSPGSSVPGYPSC